MIRPPSARVGPVTPEERKAVIAKSPVRGKYDTAVDSESAYEVLQNRVQKTGSTTAPPPGSEQQPGGEQQPSESGGVGSWVSGIGAALGGIFGTSRVRGQRLTVGQYVARDVTRSVVNRVAGKVAGDVGKSVAGSMGNTIGRAIVRGTLGGLLRR
jgi:hypothetical protein